MSRETFCDTFDRDADYFNGYFSNEKLTDLDEKYVAAVIDEEALTKLSRQLDVSMGQMMYLVDGFAIMIYVVLLYLLSKIVIEKNAQSISMVKILGYTGGEISRLYLVSTAVVVVDVYKRQVFSLWIPKYRDKKSISKGMDMSCLWNKS